MTLGGSVGRLYRSYRKLSAAKAKAKAKAPDKAIPMPRPMPGGGPKRPSLKKKIVGRGLVSKGANLAKSHAKEYGKQMVKHAGKKAIGSLKQALIGKAKSE